MTIWVKVTSRHVLPSPTLQEHSQEYLAARELFAFRSLIDEATWEELDYVYDAN